MSIHLIPVMNLTNRSYLPFRVESKFKPESIAQLPEAKAAKEKAAAINRELDRTESWVSWLTSFDQTSQDLHPEPGKLAVMGLMYDDKSSVDGYVEFQHKPGGLAADLEVSKAELNIGGKKHLEYSRNVDSIEVFVREGLTDQGFFISGTYGKPAEIRSGDA